jgi:predicted RNA-binding protein with PIN domain
MRWLIDGYNVIRRDPDLAQHEAHTLEDGRAALLRLVAGAARASGDPFTVVFDGARRGAAAGGGQVQVTFSRPPETADDVLRRLAGELRSGAVVVSSDRAVRDAAARAGAAVVTAEQFLDALDPDHADDEDDEPPARGGNPRRPSRTERMARRALARLRPR